MNKVTHFKIPIDIPRTLVRKRDNLKKVGKIQFLEYDENGFGCQLHDEPQLDFSCMVLKEGGNTWLTTVIVEIISNTEFKTKNSHYKIE